LGKGVRANESGLGMGGWMGSGANYRVGCAGRLRGVRARYGSVGWLVGLIWVLGCRIPCFYLTNYRVSLNT
jgi:hypothetical protein